LYNPPDAVAILNPLTNPALYSEWVLECALAEEQITDKVIMVTSTGKNVGFIFNLDSYT
jgi:hypothetical protein